MVRNIIARESLNKRHNQNYNERNDGNCIFDNHRAGRSDGLCGCSKSGSVEVGY